MVEGEGERWRNDKEMMERGKENEVVCSFFMGAAGAGSEKLKKRADRDGWTDGTRSLLRSIHQTVQ